MKRKPYPKIQPSGVEWLGDVPAHWRVARIRFYAQLNPSKQEVAGKDPDMEVPFLPMEAIGEDGSLSLDQFRRLEDVLNGYTYFAEGDVTYAKITPCFENGKGALMSGLDGGFGFGTTELTVLRPRSSAHPRFVWWLTQSHQFRKLGEASMYGAGGQKRVPDSFAADFSPAWPPLEEQDAINAFLDRETAKIDALIAEQRTLIERLREKRHSSIHTAITKGLNRDCPFKESDKEWIGLVPAHWSVRKIKYVAKLESGHTPSRQHPEWWIPEECTVPWISLTDVNQFRDDQIMEIFETNEKVSPVGLANSSARLLPAGTVVVSRTASVGFSVVMGTDMATTQDFANWICGPEIIPHYLLYAFRSMREDFRRLIMGSTHQTIYMPDIAVFSTPVPPVDEQREIVDFIRSEVGQIDELIQEAETSTALLIEHRSALITAVVTGKVDVREATTC